MSIGGRLAAGRRPFRGWSAGVEIIFMRMYVSSMCHFLRRLVESVKWTLHLWYEGVRDTAEYYDPILLRVRCGRFTMCLRLSVLLSASLACSLSLSLFLFL